ncbi:hypothetical protein [Epilithonimonas lactis]|uniref:C1q domain-containing protein n=1 Tax=Epilithonimonas lactis TaxID=421072 RepID=A0A085BLH3_9FLAO|nr:hypothetical protein [Epilithonimonas lactis]KFC23318.1 hypothetical protein IO89_01635 [Epilithonimonas lactis]SEQ09062.1 hypothetical protein SAMN04488097_1287 [Epilithonimonas lactis]
MKKLFYVVLVLMMGFMQAQNVGINSPNPLITLDVNGAAGTTTTLDGIRAPRITLAQLNVKTGYTSAHEGAMLYITSIAGGSTVASTAQVTTVGYYYYDGAAWQSVVAKAGSAVFVASLGNGLGGNTAATIAAGAFNTVPLAAVSKNIGGGVWNPTNYTYTVPNSGTYLIKSTVRLVDGSVSRNIYQAVHTANSDIPEGIWDTNATISGSSNRWTMLYNRIAYFNKGDLLRLYIYSDGQIANVSDASLNIVLISPN